MSLLRRVVVPTNILDNLKCSVCSLYLTVSPIVYINKKDLVCGRCSGNALLNQRATAFETVAEVLLFPCRYVSKGCTKKELEWEHVENHEKSCDHRPFECPLIYLEGCKWEGNSQTLLPHFATDHPHLIMKGNQFNLFLHCSSDDFKLMQVDANLFLIHVTTDAHEGKAWVGVNCAGKQEGSFCFRMEVKNPEDSNTLIFKDSVTSNQRWKFDKSSALELSISSMKTSLKSSKVICNMYITGVSKLTVSKGATINMDILKELECPVCLEFMVPPIFVCQNGHSMCGECKVNLTTCSVCRIFFGNTRNIILEKLTTHITYPCKNNNLGCNFLGNSSSITDHHKKCMLKTISCPLSESEKCSWKDTMESRSAHVHEKHSHVNWMVVKQKMFRHLRSPVTTDFHIMSCKEQLFKVCCKHSLNLSGSVSWAFQQIDLEPDKPPEYRFEIEFLDQTNNGRKLIIDALCSRPTSDKDAFTNSLTVTYNRLAPFIADKEYLIFKYDICRL